MRYFTLCECKLFVYVVLVVVIIVYHMLATIVKCLGLMARQGTRQAFSICISIIIIQRLVLLLQIVKEHTFLEYIFGGMQINFTVSIESS